MIANIGLCHVLNHLIPLDKQCEYLREVQKVDNVSNLNNIRYYLIFNVKHNTIIMLRRPTILCIFLHIHLQHSYLNCYINGKLKIVK